MDPAVTGEVTAAVVALVVIGGCDTNVSTTARGGPMIAPVERGVGTPPLVAVEVKFGEAVGRGEVAGLNSEAQGCPHSSILRANAVRFCCDMVMSTST